ncbi:MAG: hypothetical protein HUJ56_08445, partial [Erysipelotrichaceae bacterium]|nr:hypothetical protein [Erysipelotrichaceae bacterium]
MFKKKGEEDVREVSKDGGQEDIQDRSKSVPEGSSDKSENKEVEKKECSPEDKAKKEQIFTELVDAIKELTNLLRTQNQGPSLMDTLLGNNVSSGLESLPKGSDMKASLSRTPGIENI